MQSNMGLWDFWRLLQGVIVVDVVSENIIFPSLAKKGLNLSPAVLFLSLLYWSFVLGPVGVLLSVPLTVFVKIVLESFEIPAGLPG